MVEGVMAAKRRRAMVPRRKFFKRVKKRPVLRDADFRFAAGDNTFALDDLAGLAMCAAPCA